MLRHRVYYGIKPYVPWRVRMAARGVLARWQRRRCRGVWPIDEAAAQAPDGWRGWPDGRRFAFVITHDVEGSDGLARCRQLMRLEIELGFRSSFGFVPEGDYRVPAELRAELGRHGFGVAVHDLHHNGSLYASKRAFSEQAMRINAYLKSWDATGFRSGFMFHNLDWLHQLDITHDTSTFDTDPFEPQSDGTGTIFPFWVPAPAVQRAAREEGTGTRDKEDGVLPHSLHPSLPSPLAPSLPQSLRNGYVEIPYTLPQDSTLFLLLREKSPEIWLRKLDWIAERGGMALVNVHPDYLRFEGDPRSPRTYPVEHYRALLVHLRKKYADQFWNPTPGELARWYGGHGASHRSSPVPAPAEIRTPSDSTRLKDKRVAVVLYSSYPADPRPRRAAEALAGCGAAVDVLCLRNGSTEPRRELVNGVQVFRVPMRHRRAGASTYLFQYGRFIASAFWFLASRGARRRYDVVHVHNMPDALVFSALVPKLLGARVILDLHDPMPELMMSINSLEAGHVMVRLLRRLERWSIRFSHLTLTPNQSFKDLFVSRGAPPEKVQIVMNAPEERIFDPRRFPPAAPDDGQGDAFHIMHHGLIAHRHGVDLLVEAVARVRPRIPGVQLHIYGGPTPFLDTVLAVARDRGVADIVHYHGYKKQDEIAAAIHHCHLGVVPNRRSPFTELNLPTRVFEYLALHRPVIAPATRGIMDYFRPDQLLMFEPGDVDDLAARILWVREHPGEVRSIVGRGLTIYCRHLWRHERTRFLACLLSVLDGAAPAPSRREPSTIQP